MNRRVFQSLPARPPDQRKGAGGEIRSKQVPVPGKKRRDFSSPWNSCRAVRAALLLAPLALAACRGRPAVEVPSGPTPEAVYVLEPVFTNAQSALVRGLLDELFPGAVYVNAEQAEPALNRCSAEGKVLIVPSPRDLPQHLQALVFRFLDRGLPVVWWGRDPLAERIGRDVDGLQREEALFTDLLASAAESRGRLAVKTASVAGEGGAAAAVPDGELAWPAVTVSTEAYRGRLGLQWTGLRARTVASSDNTLALYVRCDSGATRLVIEAVERDGSRWVRSVAPTAAWSPVLAHEASFVWSAGGAGRGQRGDHLDLSSLRDLFIGLSDDVLPQAPGAQRFSLSDARAVSDPRALEDAVGWPDLPLLAPPFRRYDVAARSVEFLSTGQTLPADGLALQSPLPRGTGFGGEQAERGRWIPLARALDDDGSAVGWPASLYVRRSTNAPALLQYAWVAVDPDLPHRELVGQMLRTAVRRLRAGYFLHEAGADRGSFPAGRTFDVTARWSPGLGRSQALRVATELINHEGRTIRRVLSEPPPPGDPADTSFVKLSLGTSRRLVPVAADFIIRVSLVDREDRQVYDTLDQVVKIFPDEPPFDDRVVAEGSGFSLGRRPLFFLGVDYAPHVASGLTEEESARSWLHPGRFDLRVVQRDLDRLQQLGMNLLSVTYREPAEGAQLRAVLEEARVRGLWVNVHLESLHPLHPDFARAHELIEAAHLAANGRAFALEIARNPAVGSFAERGRLDDAWSAWIAEQYGSVSRAEELLAQPLWRREGRLTGPDDEDLAAGTNPVVQVYRRFVQDLVSRRLGEVRRFLDRESCRQLLTMRFSSSAEEGVLPLDALTGAAHLDFMTLDGAALAGSNSRIQSAGFLTAYARGVAGGKPVLWAGLGATVGAQAQAAERENQTRVAEQLLAMAANSRAAGTLAGAFTARDRERDNGLAGPDARWNPSAETFRNFSGRLRQTQIAPQPWRGRELPILPAASGLAGLWATWRDAYAEETAGGRMEELRPSGFGAETRNATFLSLADVQFEDPAPFALLNAEWGSVQVAGVEQQRAAGEILRVRPRQELRLEIINTGPATWNASQERQSRTVWLRATQPGKTDQRIRVPLLAFGDRSAVTWPATDPGPWLLRAWVSDVGSFGEALRVDVAGAPVTP